MCRFFQFKTVRENKKHDDPRLHHHASPPPPPPRGDNTTLLITGLPHRRCRSHDGCPRDGKSQRHESTGGDRFAHHGSVNGPHPSESRYHNQQDSELQCHAVLVRRGGASSYRTRRHLGDEQRESRWHVVGDCCRRSHRIGRDANHVHDKCAVHAPNRSRVRHQVQRAELFLARSHMGHHVCPAGHAPRSPRP